MAKQILRIPAALLMPLILLFCIVGSFAINNSLFGVVVMLVAGVIGFFMERWGFPVAPTILGVVLGTMLEEHFFSSLIKADGNFLVFFERPIAGTLGALCLLIWLWPLAQDAARQAGGIAHAARRDGSRTTTAACALGPSVPWRVVHVPKPPEKLGKMNSTCSPGRAFRLTARPARPSRQMSHPFGGPDE